MTCHPQERSDQHHIAWALTPLARAALARARPARAALLLGAAAARRAASNAHYWPTERGLFERFVAATRAHLTEAEFAAAWAEGEAMQVEQAIAEALEEATAG
jgi:neutral trehalase